MTTKTEAEKALDDRAKALDAREKDLNAREAALPAEAEPEDLTPTPTQAEMDNHVRNLGGADAGTYKTRDSKAG